MLGAAAVEHGRGTMDADNSNSEDASRRCESRFLILKGMSTKFSSSSIVIIGHIGSIQKARDEDNVGAFPIGVHDECR